MAEYGTYKYMFQPMIFKVLQCNHMITPVLEILQEYATRIPRGRKK